MHFVVSGHHLEIEPDVARSRLSGHPAEDLHVHWVELEGRRWPPKQALEVISGLQRASYTAHQALSVLRRLGFETSEWRNAPKGAPRVGVNRAAEGPETWVESADAANLRERLHAAVEGLADFMDGKPLTSRIAALEADLVSKNVDEVTQIADDADVTTELLASALAVRSSLGRLNDVIHAAVITLSLPHILVPGETITNRPSLAAGNDPTRPFDLETSHRVAEFKVSVWRGADAMRKRGAFADLVHLALDESDRRKQLYVVGAVPGAFLDKTLSPARWGLTRGSAALSQKFEERYGSLDIPISEFRRDHAGDVDIIDLKEIIPGLSTLIGD
ncbi:hypothetical protein Q9R29_01120 [Rothia sp. ARF10]|nr:hypothetical protein [Rothia sp. ARF10]